MAKKISITLRKGGSGKTTTAVNLAAALHRESKRVLLVDLDPQANATMAVGIDPLAQNRHIVTLFTDASTNPVSVILQTAQGLRVLPGHPELAKVEASMGPSQIDVLKGILEPLEELYDYIVVDTPPSESPLTINALAAANSAVIPLQAHFLALQGLSQAFAQIESVRAAYNPTLKVDGILPTMVNPRTRISQLVLEQVRQRYPELALPFGVDYSVKHSEATLAGIPIVFYDQFHPGSQAYIQLANVVL
jgi:chromosome partitioning protein